MCDVSDPRILNAYYSITEDEPINWYMKTSPFYHYIFLIFKKGYYWVIRIQEMLSVYMPVEQMD